MGETMTWRASLALVLVALCGDPAFAGGHGGGHAGAVFRPAGGFHARGGDRFGRGGGSRTMGGRGLPPIAGVIHERPGMRPYTSAYGHTDTAVTGAGRAFAGRYGHLGTGLRLGGGRRFAGYGLGGGYGFGGGYGAPGIYGDAGVYGGQGTYGALGTYGDGGTYGGYGTTATQSVYGNGGFSSYRSERPLAARFAEPPLAPSPYAPYSPDDRYAYAAAADVGPAPRILAVNRAARTGCDCGYDGGPVIYRYGIGTAY